MEDPGVCATRFREKTLKITSEKTWYGSGTGHVLLAGNGIQGTADEIGMLSEDVTFSVC